jgi:acetyl-CoA/propionyl-CoA carboxylase carboxyl transferase subunit
MNSRSLGATGVYVWPDAIIDVMGAEAAVGVLHRRKLAEVTEEQRPHLLAELTQQHAALNGGLDKAMELGVLDEIVTPDKTRSTIGNAIHAAPAMRGRHTNIPL